LLILFAALFELKLFELSLFELLL